MVSRKNRKRDKAKASGSSSSEVVRQAEPNTGRKTLITDSDRLQVLYKELEKGLSLKNACQNAGFSNRTVLDWLAIAEAYSDGDEGFFVKRGSYPKEDKETFLRFSRDYHRARAHAKELVTTRVHSILGMSIQELAMHLHNVQAPVEGRDIVSFLKSQLDAGIKYLQGVSPEEFDKAKLLKQELDINAKGEVKLFHVVDPNNWNKPPTE